jgi:hypothetical protein
LSIIALKKFRPHAKYTHFSTVATIQKVVFCK